MGKKRVIKKTEKELLAETEKVDKSFKKEISITPSQKFRKGRIYISSSYNNTIITLTDDNGNVLVARSAGSIGFKGTKKGTSYAASKVAQAIGLVCDKLKIRRIDIFIKGVGGGRNTALKALINQGLEVESIHDVTPIPHNGCRPKKARRT